MKVFVMMVSVFVLINGLAYSQNYYGVELIAESRKAEEYYKKGDYNKAIFHHQSALKKYRKDNNKKGILFSLERIGWIEREMGEYGLSLKVLREAYPISLKLYGDGAHIDASLGDVYMFSGANEKALEHYQRTIKSLKSFKFPTRYTAPPSQEQIFQMFRKTKALVHARTNMGILFYFEKRYKDALKTLREAETLIKDVEKVIYHPMYGMFIKLPADIYEGVGYCYTTIGAVLGHMGQFDSAFRYFVKGREAFQKGKIEMGELVNQALRYQVEFFKSDMKIDDSKLLMYDRLINRAKLMGVNEVVWRMCNVVGDALLRQKDNQKAVKYLAQAVDTIEITRSKLREDTIKKLFASSVQDVYEKIVKAFFELGKYRESFDYAERGRARAFLDMLAGRSLKAKKKVSTDLIKEEKALEDKIDIIKRALSSSTGDKRNKLYKEYIALLKKRKDILERIRDQSLEYVSTITVTTVPADRIISSLEKDTAIISYVVGKDVLLIFVLRKDGGISGFKKEISSNDLKELVFDFREAIASQQELLFKQLGEILTETLISPIKENIAGVKRIIIVPSRCLNYLPFSSLPLSEEDYLINRYVISLLPNASSLFYMGKGVTEKMDALFAMGNPLRPEKGMSLEFAEKEVKAISAYFKKPIIFMGKDAKESVVKSRNLNGVSMIHIAAHGRYNHVQPLKSAILLAGGDGEDGNLEAFEVFSLSMNPRLVVISACESGLGKVSGGEDVESLNRAFIYAGAGGVVASLWKVSDESTCALMGYFYEELRSMPPADALRSAQLKVMKKYPSPFFWASFYLTGGIKRR